MCDTINRPGKPQSGGDAGLGWAESWGGKRMGKEAEEYVCLRLEGSAQEEKELGSGKEKIVGLR